MSRFDEFFDAAQEEGEKVYTPPTQPTPKTEFDKFFDANAPKDAGAGQPPDIATPEYSAWVQFGTRIPADRAARVRETANRVPLPEDVIDRRLEEIESIRRKREILNRRDALKDNPVLLNFLAESPYVAGTVLSDKDAVAELNRLGKLEKLLTLPPDQWRKTDKELNRIAKARVEARRKGEEEFDKAFAAQIPEYQKAGEQAYAAGITDLLRRRKESRERSAEMAKKGVNDREIVEEYWKLREMEDYVTGEGPEGFVEWAGRKNWYELIPFAGDIPEAMKNLALLDAAQAVKEGHATEDEINLLRDFQRVSAAEQRRGKDFFSRTADIVAGSLPFVAELGLTEGVYTAAKAGARKAIQKLLKEEGKEGIAALLKRATTAVVSRTVGVAAQAAVSGLTSMPGEAIKRKLQGDDDVEAYGKTLISGMIETGTERISGPLGKMFTFAANRLGDATAKSLLRKAIEAAVIGTKKLEQLHVGGVASEEFEEIAGRFLHTALLGEEWKGVLGNDVGPELAAFLIQPYAAAPYTALLPPRVPDMDAIEKKKEMVGTLAETLKESVLNTNAPAESARLLETMTKEDASVPFVDFQEFSQKLGEDPRAKAATMGILSQYEEAEKSGTDIVIPRAKAAKLVGTEEGAGFNDILSWTPGEMSPNEAKKFFEENAPATVFDISEHMSGVELDELNQFEEGTKELTKGSSANKESMFSLKLRPGKQDRGNADTTLKLLKRKLEILQREENQPASPEGQKLRARHIALIEKAIAAYSQLEAADPIQESADRLEESIKETLVKDAKFKDDQASAYAEQIAAFYRVQGLRSPGKITAEELFKKFPVVFERGGFPAADAYTIFDENLVKITGYEQPTETGQARGTYTPREEMQKRERKNFARVLFQKDANLSTLLHEMGHHYLEVMFSIAQQPEADPRLVEDMNTVLKWFGVESIEKWNSMTTDQRRKFHEKWATANEVYALEGKAPSNLLKRVFNKFMSWLTWLYKSRRFVEQDFKKRYGIDLEFNPSIAAVMDRMLATQEEIDATEKDMGVDLSVYSTPEKYGMTPKQSEEILGRELDAQASMAEELRGRFLQDIKKKDEATYKELFERVKQDVRDDVNKEPVQIAYYAMKQGTMPDGSNLPPGINHAKLGRADIAKNFGGQEVVNSMPPGILADSIKGNIYPDNAAEQYGFNSGDALVKALVNMEMREHKVERIAKERMGDLYPNFYDDQEARAEEAVNAYHNDKRELVLRKTLEWLVSEDFATYKKLDRKLDRRIPSNDAVKADAEAAVGKLKVRSVHPEVYRKAEAKAHRAAQEAKLRGDWTAAFDAHLMELVNYKRYRAAMEAKQDVKRGVAYSHKFRSEAVRQRLGKTGYLEQIEGILGRFGLGPKESRAAKATRKTVEAFIKEKHQEGDTFGEEVYADAHVLNEDVEADYRNLSVDEFSGMMDTVRQLDHIAIELNNYRIQEERIAFTEAKNELAAAIRSNIPGRPPPPLSLAGENVFDKFNKAGRYIDAAFIKTEQIANWVDNNNVNGPFHKLIWEPTVDAQVAYHDIIKKVGAKVAKYVQQMPKQVQKRMMEKIDVPGLPFAVTRADAIAMFWSLGTYSNQQKTERGEQSRIHNGRVIGMTPQQMRYAIDQLEKVETDYAQGMLDTLHSLWPDVAALQKRVTGLEPPKLEAQRIVTKHGVYPGGYFPMMYDKAYSKQMGVELSENIGEKLIEPGYVRATTPQSHTKARAEAFAAPVDFGAIFRLPQHIAGVIKDLTHREAIFNINKLLLDPDIRNVFGSTLGPEYHKRLLEWVRQIANDRNFVDLGSMRWFNRGVEHLRLNTTMAQMSLKMSVMLSQSAGYAAASEVIGPQNLARGMSYFLKNPKAAWLEAEAESGELRHRQKTYEDSISNHFQRIEGKNTALANAQRVAMHGIGIADMLISIPTYFGGKFRQMDNTPDDPKAGIKAGEAAVRLSQGAGGAKDLAAVVASKSPLLRLGTMFYSWASAAYGRFRDIGRTAGGLVTGKVERTPENIAWLAVRLLLLWPLSATIASITSGQGPKEDEEWAKWFAKTVGLYPLLTIPFVRDFANPVVMGYDYRLTPVEKPLNLGVQIGQGVKNIFTGEADLEKLGADTFNLSGYIFGLPTAQLSISGEYMKDWVEGDVEPESLDQLFKDFFYRRPRERNRD